MSYLSEILADSPVGVWLLDETSGTNADDSSGNNLDGTYVGTVTVNGGTVFGKVAANFVTDGRVEIPDNALFSPQAGASGLLTLEAIVNADSVSAGCIVAKGGGGGGVYEYEVWFDSGLIKVYIWISTGGSLVVERFLSSSLSTATDYHIVVTFNRSTEVCKIYVNGVVQSDNNWVFAATNSSDTASPVTIGRRADNAHPFDGRIACVAIYPTDLSDTRIADHYTALIGVPPSAPTILDVDAGHERLAGQWSVPDDGGSPITDYEMDHATAAAPTTWLGPTSIGGSATSGAITGLTNGVAYVFRVRAINAMGNGAWSSTSSSATPFDDRGNFVLESGDLFLLESGDEFLLESGTGVPPPNEGSVTGAVGWAGSVSGVRTPKGSITGAVGWAGTATGARLSKGSVSGAIGWVGTVNGEEPIILPNEGTVSGAVGWAGTVTGARVSLGSVSGAIGWSGVVIGGSLGIVIGAVGWVGSVSGARLSKGSVSGAIGWVGSVDGETDREGSVTGAVAWVGSVIGETPLDIFAGSVDGAISWVGSVTGARQSQGSVSGAIGWAGFVVGGNLGIVIGAIAWEGTVTGERSSEGTVDGAIIWAGTVQGPLGIEAIGFITGDIFGPGVKLLLINGLGLSRRFTGPNVSHVVTGPDIRIEDLNGPSNTIVELDGPDVSRIATGPGTSRTLTGPET